MIHLCVISREATHVRWRKYRSRQTITSSLSVASRSIINHKKQRLVKVGTFSVRTLRTDFIALELKKLAADLKIDVLVIQEHRRSTSDVDFQRNLPKGWQILLGAPSAPSVGGIGFLLSSQCSPWLLDYKFVTDRVAVASFDIGNRRLYIICVYALTASVTLSDTKESVDFYDCVSTLISNIPSRDLQIVCGDFNAPLQRDGHRVKNSCGIPTVNSDHLPQVIEAIDLIPMNGNLRQKTNQLPTFRGPNERVTRLDWILSKNIDKSHITKINNVMPKIVRSDHTILIANIDVKWKRISAKIAPKTDWSQLGNTDCISRFVDNFQRSREEGQDFVNAVRYASNALPVKRRQSSHLWYDNPELDNARRQIQSCTDKYGVSSRQYADATTNLEALHASAAAQTASEIIDEIGLHTEQRKPAAAWRAINRLTGRKFKPFNCLSAASIADRKRQLTNHYSAILNSEHNEQQQQYRLLCSQQWQQQNGNQESAPFTTTEIRAALRTPRNDTSPGLDEIPNRFLKIPELEGEVTDMLNRHSKALNNENTIPDDWRKSVIVSIPKKGNSTALDNQRGIAKTCSSAKLFDKVLLSRLKPIIDPQLSQCQSGFRAGRSTTEQVMALRCVNDTCRITNMTASLVFVDFRKAFDTLHRSSIPVILSLYNVPNCLISDIIQMYSDTSACVSTELGPTEWFKTTSGVLQGDTLSPYLFIVLLNYTLKKTLQGDVGFVVCKPNGRRHPAIYICALAYADDICLLAESIDDVECSLHRLESSAAEIGLTINYNKTKVMHLGQTSVRHVRFANGDPVDSCNKFEYLGVPTSNAETVFRSRLSKAWAAATKLRSIFNSKANDY